MMYKDAYSLPYDQAKVPSFHSSEVITGPEIGHGAFGVVLAVVDLRMSTDEKEGVPETLSGMELLSQGEGCPSTTKWSRLLDSLPFDLGENSNMPQKDDETAQTSTWNDSFGNMSLLEMQMKEALSGGEEEKADPTVAEKSRTALVAKFACRTSSYYIVLKQVRDFEDEVKQEAAIEDLAFELKCLRCLKHPNIVQLQGTVGIPGSRDFGIMLIRLTCTLSDKMEEWKSFRNSKCKVKGVVSYLGQTVRRKMCQHLLQKRLRVCSDISNALTYLHVNRIVYRDLKPANCGFTYDGTVQLFDFGLARELTRDILIDYPDGYAITGCTGSPRYMAPEVMLSEPYGFSADVYSFAMLVWSIFTSRKPFHSCNDLPKFVENITDGKRPSIRAALFPKEFRSVIEKAWSGNKKKRPKMKAINEQLAQLFLAASKDDKIVEELCGGAKS